MSRVAGHKCTARVSIAGQRRCGENTPLPRTSCHGEQHLRKTSTLRDRHNRRQIYKETHTNTQQHTETPTPTHKHTHTHALTDIHKQKYPQNPSRRGGEREHARSNAVSSVRHVSSTVASNAAPFLLAPATPRRDSRYTPKGKTRPLPCPSHLQPFPRRRGEGTPETRLSGSGHLAHTSPRHRPGWQMSALGTNRLLRGGSSVRRSLPGPVLRVLRIFAPCRPWERVVLSIDRGECGSSRRPVDLSTGGH